jgi:RNA polymerase sigma-70 factor (ECF subfamily)
MNVADETYFDAEGSWKAEQRPVEWKADEGPLLDNTAFLETLTKCMSLLPQSWNLALQLKFLEETDSQDICQELNISATNFWQIIHRAKLQLRKCLEVHWFKK